ncbi:MAG: hypothetical protein Q7Q73_09065 [Verrucomicrobiota bacterium JB024]|nr:hypothetical protein [Verrucomicrobiota bacterium JB024]
MGFTGFILLAVGLAAAKPAPEPDANLVAVWSFGSSGLQSDFGSVSLLATVPQRVELRDGTLVLHHNASVLTNAADVMPSGDYTLWLRMKTSRVVNGQMFAGYVRGVDSSVSGGRPLMAQGWDNIVHTALFVRDGSSPVKTQFRTGKIFGEIKSSNAVSPDEYFELALVFNKKAGRGIRVMLNGVEHVYDKLTDAPIAEPNALAFGFLRYPGVSVHDTMTIDEIRLYRVAVSPEVLASLSR